MLLRTAIANAARAHSRGAVVSTSRGLVQPLHLPRLHSTHAHATAAPLASDAYTKAPHAEASPATDVASASHLSSPAAATSVSPSTLSPNDRKLLESMLRVDHAGEVAANTIYQAQADVFGRLGDQKTKQMMLDMWETEKKHLAVAKKLLRQHNVAPSALLPVWSLAGSVLGGVTALLGKQAAMACTEAVETVIGEHYDDQLVHLKKVIASQVAASQTPSAPSDSAPPHPSLPLLADVIEEFKNDELEHLDTAVEHEAQQAPAHALLSAIVGFGCKGAIQIAKRF